MTNKEKEAVRDFLEAIRCSVATHSNGWPEDKEANELERKGFNILAKKFNVREA